MPQLILAALILWGGWTATRWASRARPEVVAAAAKRTAGVAAMAVALFVLVARGNVEAAVPIAALGAWLLGWTGVFGSLPIGSRRGTRGQRRIRSWRSSMVEVRLDEASGAMDGRVLAGRYAGWALSQLDEADCEAVLADCRGRDADGVRLLELYIHRRFPGRRPAGQDDRDARPRNSFASGEMSENDAYQILGLAAGATREEIARAHRTLMKKVHPDHGGTASLAALLNQAKDILTRRHG